jgi:hypothetical protein
MLPAYGPMTRPGTFYILGNGPSLTPRILKALPDGAWLGMNSAFRYWDRIGKYPRYYACLDPVVLRSQFEGIRSLLPRPEITDFFLHDCAAEFDPSLATHPKVTLLSAFLQRSGLRLPVSRLGHEKQTTGALATRFVIEKGHDEIQLIGVDCKYVEQIDGAVAAKGIELVINKRLTSNPNYFFGDYQAAGDRYQVPNPTLHSGNLHLQSFVAVRNDLDAAGLPVRIHVGSDRSLLSRFGIFPTRPIWNELGIRRIGAVAVPMTPREWKRQIQNLHLWMDPRFRPSMDAGPRDTCLHLFLSASPDEELRANIEAGLAEVPGLAEFFTECRITFLDIPPEIDHYRRSIVGTDDPCTKSGPNVFFLSTMAHCKDYEYVLHAETDCLPMRAGWLDAAEREIDRAGTQAWIIGPAYFGPSDLFSAYQLHINGNSIYQSGDPDFQGFLQGTFLDVLSLLLRSGFRDMAYDTALSVALHNIGVLPEPLRRSLFLALPRFAYSNFIRNVGGGKETADPGLLDLKEMLAESDQTFMLHGRPGFHYLDGDRTYLPEVYRALQTVPQESLPLLSVGSNDPGWRIERQGYGRVQLDAADGPVRDNLLLTFPFARLRGASQGRTWSLSLRTADAMPTFQHVSFGFPAADGEVVQVDAVVHRERGEDGTETLRLETRGHPGFDSDVVHLYLHGITSRPGHLVIQQIQMIEDDAQPLDRCLSLTSNPRSAGAVEVINRWHRFYESLPRFSTTADRPLWEHWHSPAFLLRHSSLRPEHVWLSAAADRMADPVVTKGPVLQGVLAGAPWHRAGSFRIRLKVLDSALDGDSVVRLCRHGHTPWEYVDVPVRICSGYGESASVRTPFTQVHHSYRIELLSLPAVERAVTVRLDVMVDLPSTLTAPNGGLPSCPERPRVLIVDPTIIGTRSATGQIKQLFFSAWPEQEILQVCELNQDAAVLGVARLENGVPTARAQTAAQVLEACKAFEADVLYVRPTASLPFMREIVPLVEALARPVAVHVMDDWMERARVTRAAEFPELISLFMRLVTRSVLKLSICRTMSRMLAARYGGHWVPLANGVDFSSLPTPQVPQGTFVIRYMGGLAEDMSMSTVRLTAEAVERARDRVDVRFEIYTMTWYQDAARRAFAACAATSVHDLVEPADYLSHLASSGALLIAYNFDETSKRYTRYSFSNKLPECLASARPVLLVGPPDIATVNEMRGESGLIVVDKPNPDALAEVIVALARDVQAAERLGAKGRALAGRRFPADAVKEQVKVLMDSLARAVADMQAPSAAPHSFRSANELMRQGQHEAALRAYATLMASVPTPLYEKNALICLNRLGLDHETWPQAVEAARALGKISVR